MRETKNKPMYSVLGLVVVAMLVLTVITLSNTLLRGARLDLTENRLYTLAEGTHQLLGQIEEPIHLYFFYSPQSAQGIPHISNYAQRVREMLQEMSEASDDRLRLSLVDPQPFSDEEDRAVELGVQAVALDGGSETLYFGLAGTNALGDTETIPFFQPNRESLLEYDLSKLIYQLSQTKKPVVGLLSTLNIGGGFDPRRMQATPAWVAVEQLRQFFELRTLESDLAEIPEDIELLLLVHPTDLAPATLYAIDQFVLGGGKALVFVDPYAEEAAGGGVAGIGGGGPARQSNPSELLAAWGVRLRANEVLTDAEYALRVTTDPAKPMFYHYAMLGVAAQSMNQEDVITRGLEGLNIAFGGILEPVADAGTEFIPLASSSDRAMPLPAQRIAATPDAADLQRGFAATGERYVLAARVSGKATSAFPDGPPAPEEDPEGESDGEGAKDEVAAEEASTKPHRAESEGPIHVVVVADTDLLRDALWVRVQRFLGQRIATPLAGNGDLLINAVDNLLGSSELISIRSRAGYSRPFERVDALKREADRRFRAKEEELLARLQETERKLSELQGQKEGASALLLSPEQEQALLGFRDEKLKIRKELRSVRHELDKSIERLGTTLKFVNIVLVPLLVSVVAIAIALLRRRRAAAMSVVGGSA